MSAVIGTYSSSSRSIATGAGGDAAEVVAVDLHRHRVRCVDHQHDTARELRDLDDLTEQSVRIDHGLTDEHAGVGAFVDFDLERVRARHDADQFGDQYLRAEALTAAEQLPQTRVFLAQRDELLGDLRQLQIALP